MKRCLILMALALIAASPVFAGDEVHEVDVSSVTGTATRAVVEADTGIDRIAELTSALLDFSAATSATVTVQVVSGSVTNDIDPDLDMGGGTDDDWSPDVPIYLKVGDSVSWTSSDTGDVFTVRFWLY